MNVELIGNGSAYAGYSRSGNAYYIPEQRIGQSRPKAEDLKQVDHVNWGDGDDMPQLLDDLWKKNPDLLRALKLKADILYASGITYRVMDETGELINKRIPEIEKFLERSSRYPLFVVEHIYQYFIAFPQLLFNANRDKILKIHPLVPRECRFEFRDKNGFLYRLYLNGKWHEGATKRDKETTKFRVIDPVYYDPYTFKETFDHKDFSVVLPSAVPSDDPYYPIPDYWSLKLSKWYDLAQKIPVFKDAIMENQVAIKYLIEMPDWWMPQTYPNWEDFEDKKKKKLVAAEVQKFENFAAGFEKAGKSLVVMTKTDPQDGKKYEGWSIKPIDDKMKDGMYVEDSLEATVKIFTAVGVDPGILGITPGKPGSSRSGSERREAINIQLMLNQRISDIILKPYHYAAIFNGWTNDNETIVFSFKKPFMQTQDKITEGQRETTVDQNES